MPPDTRTRLPVLTVNVAALLRSTPGTTRRYPVADLHLDMGGDLLQAEPIAGVVRLTRTNRGILVDGTLKTALEESCGRCLAPVVTPVEVQLREEALPTIDIETGQPVDVNEEPDALRIDDRHVLDLGQPVRDAISLAEPMTVLCRATCAGLCAVCGRDLNLEPHRHEREPDPRLAPLARLLAEKE